MAVQGDRQHLCIGTHVRFPGQHSGLRIRCCLPCGLDDPWPRNSICCRATKKKRKQKQNKKKERKKERKTDRQTDRKRDFTKTQPDWNCDLRLQAPELQEIHFCCLSHSVSGIGPKLRPKFTGGTLRKWFSLLLGG